MTVHDWNSNPAKTYYAMITEYDAAQGLGGKFPIINRREHPQAWNEWTEYFRFRRMTFSLELMAERSTQTVPCLSPFDFDPEYRQPNLGLGQDQSFGGL